MVPPFYINHQSRNSYRLAYRQVLWRQFLNWESLFSNDYSSCQVDIKPINTGVVQLTGERCITERSQGNSRQKPGGRNWSQTPGICDAYWLASWLLPSFLIQPRLKDVPRDSAPHIGLGPPTSSNNPDNDSADMLSELSDEARLQLRVSLPKCVKVLCHWSMARLLRIGGTF